MKDKVTTRIANERLKELIEFTQNTHGSIKEITKRLSKRTKKQWNRENVERWLHKDPEKRSQPLLGVGILLIQIGRELIAEHNRCHADRDGECCWQHCPQLRDGEPAKTGRHCPLDKIEDEGE